MSYQTENKEIFDLLHQVEEGRVQYADAFGYEPNTVLLPAAVALTVDEWVYRHSNGEMERALDLNGLRVLIDPDPKAQGFALFFLQTPHE